VADISTHPLLPLVHIGLKRREGWRAGMKADEEETSQKIPKFGV
jgi:hypothetical protein